MAESDWNYVGDVNLRHGGLFWRGTPSEDLVSYVRVEALRDGGGPDNLFRVSVGSLHVTDDAETVRSALETVGADPETASWGEVVLALDAYGGGNRDDDEVAVVRIGPVDPHWSGRGEFPEPDVVLRSNGSLRRWVEGEHLHGPEIASGPSPRL